MWITSTDVMRKLSVYVEGAPNVTRFDDPVDPASRGRLDVSKVGTLPETEPERTIALAERLSVILGLPAPEGRWRYLRDVG